MPAASFCPFMTIIPAPLSKDEYFMRHVYLAASMSKDPRTKIGAVLVKDGVIISEGFNGLPRGVRDYKTRLDDRELKYKFVVHGEHNAILNCARNGVSTLGSTLYTQGVPCNECAKAIVQAGIKRVIIHNRWPDMGSSEKWVEAAKITKEMFAEADIPIYFCYETLGLQALVDGKIINV